MSKFMSPAKRHWLAATVLVAALLGCQVIPATASADPAAPPPEPVPQPESAQQQPNQELHNVVYKARVDGVSRGARIIYQLDDDQVNTADPTMLPGRTFEATAVLSDPKLAGMKVSIDWPYSANLHCEIMVNDHTVARADQFIAPRLTPEDEDPGYGRLQCGAPVGGAGGADLAA